MLKTEERMALMLKADIDQLREIDCILTGMNDRQKEKKSEDYRLFTLTETAKKLQVSRPTVYRWTRTGLLRSTIIGTCRRIRASEMQEMLEAGTIRPKGRK